MSSRLQVILQAALGFLLISSLPSMALATSWGPRTDLGVAAVERQTGKVLWEAWQLSDVPDGVSKEGKAAAESLLAHSQRHSESDLVDFPFALTKALVVDEVYEESKHHLILAHGQPDAIGAEIARFSFDAKGYPQYARAGDTLYLLVDGKVHAFQGNTKDELPDRLWKPRWTFDWLAALPERERKSANFIATRLRANAEGMWLMHGPRIWQFTPQGRKQAQYMIKNAWSSWIGLPPSTLGIGKRLLYYRFNSGVIALDRHTKEEVWRLETKRFPYASRVIEVGERLVFVQIGSDVPRTIQSALGAERHPLPKLLPDTARQRVAAAMLLHSYGDGYLRKQLQEYLGQLRKMENDPDAKKAATAIDNLLATWPRRRDKQRLLDTCVTALLQAKENDPQQIFASPATQRVLTWCLLQELIYGRTPDGYDRPGVNYAYHSWEERQLPLADGVAAQLVEHCRQIIDTGPEAEKPFAASVLVSGIGWGRLTNAERKELFLSRQSSVWRWTAMSLVKNGWPERLIQWAPERPAGDHLDIIWILAHKEPIEWSRAELDFWLRCARRTPGSIAYVLNLNLEDEIPVAFRKPIRSYLIKEIANPTVKENGKQEAGDLFAALTVLDRWKNPDDTPLLRKYLKHPFRIQVSVQRGEQFREMWDYRIRQHVKNMLEKRGVQPPPGIVYEEVAGTGKE